MKERGRVEAFNIPSLSKPVNINLSYSKIDFCVLNALTAIHKGLLIDL